MTVFSEVLQPFSCQLLHRIVQKRPDFSQPQDRSQPLCNWRKSKLTVFQVQVVGWGLVAAVRLSIANPAWICAWKGQSTLRSCQECRARFLVCFVASGNSAHVHGSARQLLGAIKQTKNRNTFPFKNFPCCRPRKDRWGGVHPRLITPVLAIMGFKSFSLIVQRTWLHEHSDKEYFWKRSTSEKAVFVLITFVLKMVQLVFWSIWNLPLVSFSNFSF